MAGKDMAPFDLFIAHVRRVLVHVRSQYTDLRLVMWDDMFRAVDLPALHGETILVLHAFSINSFHINKVF